MYLGLLLFKQVLHILQRRDLQKSCHQKQAEVLTKPRMSNGNKEGDLQVLRRAGLLKKLLMYRDYDLQLIHEDSNPVVSITLGPPEKYLYRNSESFYFDHRPH